MEIAIMFLSFILMLVLFSLWVLWQKAEQRFEDNKIFLYELMKRVDANQDLIEEILYEKDAWIRMRK